MNMMMRFGYIPAPHTIYKNIFKLLPEIILPLITQTKL